MHNTKVMKGNETNYFISSQPNSLILNLMYSEELYLKFVNILEASVIIFNFKLYFHLFYINNRKKIFHLHYKRRIFTNSKIVYL